MKKKLLVLAILILVITPIILFLILPPWNKGVDQALVCRNNCQQIDAAIQEWALENKKTNGTPVTTNDILPYLKYGLPKCPVDGQYILTKVGEMPVCSMPANSHRIVY